MLEKLGAQFEGREKELGAAFRSLNKKLVRQRILRDQVRIDGRGLTDIRPLSAEVEVVPRAHGSALFERGETQIMGVTTLNMLRMEQQIDSLGPETPSATCTTTTSRPTPPVRPAASARRSAARSATARWPSGRCCPCCRPARSSRTRSARSPRRWARTARRRWARSARPRCRCSTPVCRCKAPVAGIAMGLVSDEVDGTTPLRRADRHPRRRGRVRRHGLQGRRHGGVRHRAAAGHQARRHPVRGAGRRAEPGQGRPADHPRGDRRGHRPARTR